MKVTARIPGGGLRRFRPVAAAAGVPAQGRAEATPLEGQQAPTFFDVLARVEPSRLSPLGDILRLDPTKIREALISRQPRLRKESLRDRRFREELQELGSTRGGPKNVTVHDLAEFRQRWRALSPLHPEQVTLLMEAYHAIGAAEPLVDFYRASSRQDPQLSFYEVPREMLLEALNQLGRHTEAIDEGEALIRQRLEQLGLPAAPPLELLEREIPRQLLVSSVVLQSLGQAYGRLAGAEDGPGWMLNGSSPPAPDQRALELSRAYFLEAFRTDFQPGSGVALLQAELRLGRGDEARRLVPLVEYSLKGAGIAPDPALEAELADLRARLDLTASSATRETVATPEQTQRRQITDRILKVGRTMDLALGSRFVAGSWRYVGRGGTVDMPVNRPTVRAYRRMLESLGIDALDRPGDLEEVCRRLHQFIDDQFQLVDRNGSRPMEDLRSPVHFRRDKIAELRHDLCQSRASGSSHTNPHVELLFGQGDCRGTSINFALPFSIWRRDQQVAQLRGALHAALEGDAAAMTQRLDRAREWDGFEVVMVDLTFMGNLRLEKDAHGKPMKYRLLTDSSGRPMGSDRILRGEDGKPQAIEDHSMPFLIRRDDQGLVTEMVAVDPFYQHFYPLGWRPVDAAGLLDEEKGLDLGTTGVTAADGTPIHFWGRPTAYSGSRPQTTQGDCGHETFGGQPVAIGDPVGLVGEHSAMDDLAQAMLGLSAAESKRELLQAICSSRLEEAVRGAHHRWYRARLADLRDPGQPFAGWAAQRVAAREELCGMSDQELRAWLTSRGLSTGVSGAKLESIRHAPPGTVLLDPEFRPPEIEEGLSDPSGQSPKSSEAVDVLSLARYLEDVRYGEELGTTVTGLLRGWDGSGLQTLEKVHQLACLASRLGPVGEAPPDKSWHALHELKPEQGIDFERWSAVGERLSRRLENGPIESLASELFETPPRGAETLDELIMVLYVADFRSGTEPRQVVHGLRDGTDLKGLYQLSILSQLARQASLLPSHKEATPLPCSALPESDRAEARVRLRAAMEWLEAQLETA
ncbi:MAG: hypothetical protein HY319_26765 [Armatimonadetes bacterium]|nr:hypothetical protein [Armatimonadota bacterium]